MRFRSRAPPVIHTVSPDPRATLAIMRSPARNFATSRDIGRFRPRLRALRLRRPRRRSLTVIESKNRRMATTVSVKVTRWPRRGRRQDVHVGCARMALPRHADAAAVGTGLVLRGLALGTTPRRGTVRVNGALATPNVLSDAPSMRRAAGAAASGNVVDREGRHDVRLNSPSSASDDHAGRAGVRRAPAPRHDHRHRASARRHVVRPGVVTFDRFLPPRRA